MKKERSFGAVLYSYDEKKNLVYLLEHMRLGHTSLCKGHVEGNETGEETAKREIKEETSLDVVLDTGFKHTIRYSPNPGVMKDVTFFVAFVAKPTKGVDKHDDEVVNTQWLPFDQAKEKLTYDSDKETLKEADQYIRNKISK